MYIHKIFNRHTIAFSLTILASLFCSGVLAQGSKAKPRMNLDYFNSSDESRKLVASIFIIKDRQRVPVDNGCVYYGIEGLGGLCALELTRMELKVQNNLDVF